VAPVRCSLEPLRFSRRLLSAWPCYATGPAEASVLLASPPPCAEQPTGFELETRPAASKNRSKGPAGELEMFLVSCDEPLVSDARHAILPDVARAV
jgi:hypothetical protein